MREALAELQALISNRYPEAVFSVSEGEDPEGIYLAATVDVDDRGEVIDLFLDRLVELQVVEDLPIFVVPLRTAERNAAIASEQQLTATGVSNL
jgi:hypothetical protein